MKYPVMNTTGRRNKTTGTTDAGTTPRYSSSSRKAKGTIEITGACDSGLRTPVLTARILAYILLVFCRASGSSGDDVLPVLPNCCESSAGLNVCIAKSAGNYVAFTTTLR